MSDRQPLYRYHGPERPKRAPFPGVPARDLYAEDVAGLPPGALKHATGGAKPLYVKAKAAPPDPAATTTDTPAAKAAKE